MKSLDEIERIARDLAHEISAPHCFAFTGSGLGQHSVLCEAAYTRIRATLISFNEPDCASIFIEVTDPIDGHPRWYWKLAATERTWHGPFTSEQAAHDDAERH